MRRIATVALTAGAVMASTLAVATPAEAATYSWGSPNGTKTVYAWGKVTKNGTTAKIHNAYLKDYSKNGKAACVRFLFTEGKSKYWSKHWIRYTNGGLADGKGFKVAISASSSYTSHLWVQECLIDLKTKKTAYGKGKQIY